ncbi:proteoglycan 4 isoform X2 [Callorhinchus milii]|uniref:proteoglycan 4 isoform X2 n=1 Tax=Callorhinchus milii TaxID=7868 RepID=UPI0004576360|nr:proteoglycan 4 isoform X2 [Callorhinchus milii]|eukprot:gi/632981690/ref/XP_007907730.1/ PREDICTED: glycogenin-2 [Callorhinchus milii]
MSSKKLSGFDTPASYNRDSETARRPSTELGNTKITRPSSEKSRLSNFSPPKHRKRSDSTSHKTTINHEPEITGSQEAEPTRCSPEPIGWRSLDVSGFDTPVSSGQDPETTRWSPAELAKSDPEPSKGPSAELLSGDVYKSAVHGGRFEPDKVPAPLSKCRNEPSRELTSEIACKSAEPIKLLSPLLPPEPEAVFTKKLKSNSTRPTSEKFYLRVPSPPKIRKRIESAPVKKETGAKQTSEKSLQYLSSPPKHRKHQDDGSIKKDPLDMATESSRSRESKPTHQGAPAEPGKANRIPAKPSASSPLKVRKQYETKSGKKEPVVDHKPEIASRQEPEPPEQGKANRIPAKLSPRPSSPLKPRKRYETKSVKKEPVVTWKQEPKPTETPPQRSGTNIRPTAGKKSPPKARKHSNDTSVKRESPHFETSISESREFESISSTSAEQSAFESDADSSTSGQSEAVQHPRIEPKPVRKLQPIKLLAPLHPPEPKTKLPKEMEPVILYKSMSKLGQVEPVKLLAPLFPSDLARKASKELRPAATSKATRGEGMDRRKWEEGHIDYLGKDAFSNIQKKLDQFLQ